MKEYTRREKLKPCKLSIDDLQVLIGKVQINLVAQDVVNIFSIGADTDSIKVTEPNLENFKKHFKELPDSLSNLTLWASTRNTKDYNLNNRMVNLYFSEYGITLSVAGDEEAWVNGKIEEVKKYLDSKKAPMWWLRSRAAGVTKTILGGILGGALGLTIGKLAYAGASKQLWVTFLINLILIFITQFNYGSKYSEIVLRPKENIILKNKDYILMILGLLAFILGLLTYFKN